ncbi:MAG: hypothetical protein JW751_18965 [Polyangiaceae bacterium]|nr:hypothetical protein [Polyangiaceae bacterium]
MTATRNLRRELDGWLDRSPARAGILCGSSGAGEPSALRAWVDAVRQRGDRVAYVRIAQAEGTLLEHDLLRRLESEASGTEPLPMTTPMLRDAVAIALNEPPDAAARLVAIIDGIDGCVDWPENGAPLFAELGEDVRMVVTVTGPIDEARPWMRRLGGEAEVIACAPGGEPGPADAVDALWRAFGDAPGVRDLLSLLARAFAPVPAAELLVFADQDTPRPELSAHPVAARLLQIRDDGAVAFASEAARRRWMASDGGDGPWDARWIAAAARGGAYLRGYAAAHATRAHASVCVLRGLCTPMRLLAAPPDEMSRSFAELCRIGNAAQRDFLGPGADRAEAWATLTRSAIGTGALLGIRRQLVDQGNRARDAVGTTLRALVRAAADPDPIRELAARASFPIDPAMPTPPDPAAAAARSRELFATWDRDGDVTDYVALVAGLDLPELRRVIDACWPMCVEFAATRLAVLGQGEEALALALTLPPEPARCRSLLRIALASGSGSSAALAEPARADFAALAPASRTQILLALPDAVAAVFSPDEALAMASALGDEGAGYLYPRIVALARIARCVAPPHPERAMKLAMDAYRAAPDPDALDDLVACARWMTSEDAAWLLVQSLGLAAPYDGIVSVLVGHGGLEHLAPLVARAGGDELLGVTAQEVVQALEWLAPSAPAR